jgi:hypothetical protein
MISFTVASLIAAGVLFLAVGKLALYVAYLDDWPAPGSGAGPGPHCVTDVLAQVRPRIRRLCRPVRAQMQAAFDTTAFHQSPAVSPKIYSLR